MFEFLEIKNYAEYNPLLVAENTPFTQAWFYGEWQEMTGRKVRRFEVKRDFKIIGFFQIIKYPLLFSQSFLYIPHAPVLRSFSVQPSQPKLLRRSRQGGDRLPREFLKEFQEKLVEIGKEENAIFVRFDVFPKTEENLSRFFKKVPSYAYHSSYFQPKSEWVIDLKKTEEELLNEMHPKNRYNIRLAEKKEVKIEIVKDDFKKYFEEFYALLKETAKRDNFNLHPKTYYQNVFATLEENNAFLAVARYEEKILLINLILLYGQAAYFAFGGSSGEHKNLMFSHLAQWEAIKEAKRRGFEVYNFGGIGNGGKGLEGVSFFKKRFGGELLEYSDSYDLILKPFWHWLYNMRQKIR